MKTVKTPKGTELPLIDLRGKDYLQVAHRIQWLNEEASQFSIETEILKSEPTESIVRAKVSIIQVLDDVVVNKSATATKREDAKGFGDHLEKAETGSVGRALAMLGYGTQFALSDLDEAGRVVDSPQTPFKTHQDARHSNKTTNQQPSIENVWEKQQRAKEQEEIKHRSNRLDQALGAEMEPETTEIDRPAALTVDPGAWIFTGGKYEGRAINAIKLEELKNYLLWLEKAARDKGQSLGGWAADFKREFNNYTSGAR